MALFHYNVATEGIRAGHKILSVLGLKWLTVEIIVPPVQRDRPAGGGAGRGPIPDLISASEYYHIRVTIKYNGKTVVKLYKTKFADVIARIVVSLDSHVFTPVFVMAKLLSNEIRNKLIKVSEHYTQDIPEVNIKVQESLEEPIIKVRRKE